MKRLTHSLQVLLTVCLLLTLLCITAQATAPPAADLPAEPISGFCGGEGDGSNLTWTLTPEGVLTISGKGAMADYDGTAAPWYPYRSVMTNLVLSEGITTIGKATFQFCSGFSGDLIIPDSVVTLGANCFSNAYGPFGENSAGDLVIGNGVTTIGEHAFLGCSNFSGTLTLGSRVESIGYYAFEGCSGFTGGLVIPDSVTTIGTGAFRNCSGFDGSLVFGKGLTSIGAGSFQYCRGFTGGLTFPDSLTLIGHEAFADCTGFDGKLSLGSGLITLGESAFFNCSGFSGTVKLPTALHQLPDKVFYGCTGITAFTVDSDHPNYSHKNGVLFSKNQTELILYPGGGPARYIVPEGVTDIGTYAFAGCSTITQVIFSPSVVNILGCAFQDCSALTDFYFQGDAPTIPAPHFYELTPFSTKVRLHYVEGRSGWTDQASGYNPYDQTWNVRPLSPWSGSIAALFPLNTLTLRDNSGRLLTAIPDGIFTVETAIAASAEEDLTGCLFALYTSDGQLLRMAAPEPQRCADGTAVFTLRLDNTQGQIGTLKFFQLNSLLDPAPMAEALSI